MTQVKMTSDVTVKLIRVCASDDSVIQSAQTSAKGENKPDTVPARLINSLMKNQHGVPFEHNMFTFFFKMPITAARELVKHRIASMSEMSGRYMELLPEFYTPGPLRKMRNIGTSMEPVMVADDELRQFANATDLIIAQKAWDLYEQRLERGMAKELARNVLPVNIMTQIYFTMNARSMMNFLKLRVESDDSLVRSRPMWEIQMVADQVELHFAEHMPLTHAAFVANGRVAP